MAPKPERPWFTSPLLPTVLCLAGITALLLDGLSPWQTFWRRRQWTPVKGQLTSGVERRRRTTASGQGETHVEYLVKRSQRQIFSKIVTRGWPLRRKARVWFVKITYTYPWKTGRITRVADSPGREFDAQQDAAAFLARRVRKGNVRVWVNPANPAEATAFLDYPSVPTLVIGFVLLGLGLVGLVLSLVLRRVHVRQEGL
jgi:hypothetical protein